MPVGVDLIESASSEAKSGGKSASFGADSKGRDGKDGGVGEKEDRKAGGEKKQGGSAPKWLKLG